MKISASHSTQVIERARPEVRTTAADASTGVNQAEARAYYDKALDGIGKLVQPIDPDSTLRQALNDIQVRDKTGFNLRDNDTARELKQEYREAYDGVRNEQRMALGIAAEMGPGTHKLSDGSTVQVAKNKDGSTSVTTTNPDGSTKTVEVSKGGTQCTVTSTDADGNETVIERDGTTVTTTKDGQSTAYSLDENGRPTRSVRNGILNSTTTTVNEDGSTDTTTSVMCRPPVTRHEPGRDLAIYKPTADKL